MPMTYSIDTDGQLVHIVGTGRVTDDDLIQCIASLREDPQLEPDMNTLSDMREIEVAFTLEGVTGC